MVTKVHRARAELRPGHLDAREQLTQIRVHGAGRVAHVEAGCGRVYGGDRLVAGLLGRDVRPFRLAYAYELERFGYDAQALQQFNQVASHQPPDLIAASAYAAIARLHCDHQNLNAAMEAFENAYDAIHAFALRQPNDPGITEAYLQLGRGLSHRFGAFAYIKLYPRFRNLEVQIEQTLWPH